MNVPESPTNLMIVSANYCKTLQDLGLPKESIFRWQLIPKLNRSSVQTFAWDPDGYYALAQEVIDATNQPTYIAAYSIADLDCILPEYLLRKTNTGYEVAMERIWNVAETFNCRLPDALALMAIQMIHNRSIDLKKASEQILTLKRLAHV